MFTAELEAIVSALRYIKGNTNGSKFVIFGDFESVQQALLSKWDYPTVQNIIRFYILYIGQLFFVGCPVIWKLLETKGFILQRKLH